MPCCRDPGRSPSPRSRCDECRLRADRSRTKCLRQVSELSQRNTGAVVAIDQQRANGVERVTPIVPKAHHEVEASLPYPDLRRLFAHETDPHRSNHIARRQSDPRCRLPVHGDLSCGNPVSCSARRSVSPSTPLMSASACSASRESSSRSGPKIRTAMSAGVPPSLHRCACRVVS